MPAVQKKKLIICVIRIFCLWLFVASSFSAQAESYDEPAAASASRGYDLLTKTPFLPPDFTEEMFDSVWQVWPRPLRENAANTTPNERRQMAMERYGLTPRPGDASLEPLQYVVTGSESNKVWTMNCFSCHGGSVYGVTTPGAPNNRFALQTMTEELRSAKLKLGKPLSRMDLGAMFIPLGTTHGTTNAVVFGIGLMSRRDPQLNLIDAMPKPAVHHDMDAPPWWHFHKRPHIYIDGFAERGHRGLMQFTLVPENGPAFYREHEDDFKDIYAYLMSLRPPKYTGTINHELANNGERLFNATCARCHGTYGDHAVYPDIRIPIDEIGTDPVRLAALPVEGRQKYAVSWFAHHGEPGEQHTVVKPDGYVAPPLDGVWASPPYLHNGSVPTLWHILNPETRPTIWRRSGEQIDSEKVGFEIEVVSRIPLTQSDIAVRRQYFDTEKFGKSNRGHLFPNDLTDHEKSAVLEYLKTL